MLRRAFKPDTFARYESSLMVLRQLLPTQLAAPLLAREVVWWRSASGRSPLAERHHTTSFARCRRHRGECVRQHAHSGGFIIDCKTCSCEIATSLDNIELKVSPYIPPSHRIFWQERGPGLHPLL